MVESTPHHELCRVALEQLRSGDEAIGVSEVICAAVVRVATNPRVFRPAVDAVVAFAYVDALREHPLAVGLRPGERHWSIFRELVLDSGIRGADTTDAYLAALAIEHECEWWTTDRDFSKFTALRQRNLLLDP
ncbi:MAG: PIN domain-containing protein [Deltaproteobacteria bacterium]|nr:PIN domain-containing protein [Nannocystaceae bacterium]